MRSSHPNKTLPLRLPYSVTLNAEKNHNNKMGITMNLKFTKLTINVNHGKVYRCCVVVCAATDKGELVSSYWSI